MDERLPTELVVAACLRDCNARAVPAYVVRKGAPAAGMIIAKIVMRGKGCRLQSQQRDIEGRLSWASVFDDDIVDEKRADEYLQRTTARDPDIWIVEIEDSSGKNPFDIK